MYCESHLRPHAVGTEAKVGSDHSYWQINSYYHEKSARAEGYDIYDPEENLEYGFILLKEQGVQPWVHSSRCWKQYMNPNSVNLSKK